MSRANLEVSDNSIQVDTGIVHPSDLSAVKVVTVAILASVCIYTILMFAILYFNKKPVVEAFNRWIPLNALPNQAAAVGFCVRQSNRATLRSATER